MKFLSRLNITFKNTLPIYLMISFVTFVLLIIGNYMNSFSIFGNNLGARLWFSLAYNLLYLVPQSISIFISLGFLRKKKLNWFFRIIPSSSILFTFVLILIFMSIRFFPENVDLRQLYIHFLIILIMNIMFSVIVALNIFSKAKTMMHITDPNK